MRQKKRLTPVNYIYLLFVLGICIMFLSLICSKGSFLNKMVYDFSYFADFFDHVRRFYLGLDSVYAEGMHACFPPLAYCIYYLISRMLYYNNIDNPQELSYSGSGLLIICLFTALLAIFFIFGFLRLCRLPDKLGKKVLAVLLFASYPFWLAVERGNLSFLVLILLMYAMDLKDSGSGVQREAALVLFAIAAALKLYPAILGIFYLAEKRYKEAVRLIFYGCLFFFLPFAFFHGMDGFFLFLRNITAVNSGATGVTIVGIVGRIGDRLGLSLATGHAIGKIISYFYFLFVIVACFKNKIYWKRVSFVTSLMIIFVAASGTYCLVYWVIPFVCFLNYLYTKTQFTAMDYVYATLFSLTFIAYPISIAGSSGMLYMSLYTLLGLLIIEQLLEVLKKLCNSMVI